MARQTVPVPEDALLMQNGVLVDTEDGEVFEDADLMDRTVETVADVQRILERRFSVERQVADLDIQIGNLLRAKSQLQSRLIGIDYHTGPRITAFLQAMMQKTGRKSVVTRFGIAGLRKRSACYGLSDGAIEWLRQHAPQAVRESVRHSTSQKALLELREQGVELPSDLFVYTPEGDQFYAKGDA